MEPLIVGYIVMGLLLVFLLSGIHIGIVMGLLGFVGMVLLNGWSAGLGLLKTVPYSTFFSYDFSVVPLFVLMGEFCFQAGISGDLFSTAHKLIGHLRGGLCMATIGACAAFSAVSGSSVATAATMSVVVLPEMRKYKYDMSLATGTLAAGGTLGILIPPSIMLIIYGMLTEQSIGTLFLAGFIPGILKAFLLISIIGFRCWLNPALGPKGPNYTLLEKIVSFKNTWVVLILFLVVIGGIYFGIFSPTEGAGIGAFGAFIFAIARKRLSREKFLKSLLSTVETTGMIFFMMLGAFVLGYFFAVTRLPNEMADMLSALHINRYVIWAFIMFIYIILGCFMDTLAMVLLTVPVFYPVVCGPMGLGFDPIWFGIMIVIVAEMGMITPPVGMNLFIIRGMAPEVPAASVIRGVIPFIFADIILVCILTALPIIVLFLPQLL